MSRVNRAHESEGDSEVMAALGGTVNRVFKYSGHAFHMFFYKHSVFQTEARTCLFFHKSSLKISLKYAYLRTFK